MKLILRTIIMSILFITSLNCCKTNSMNREEIKKALKSNDQYSIMDAIYWIGESQDTSFIEDIFKLSYDPRISHQKEFLGMSVHQACMNTFKKISHKAPPNVITDEVDSLNVAFYRNLLKKE